MYTEFFNPIYGTVDGLPVIVLGAMAGQTRLGPYLTWMVVDEAGQVRQVAPEIVNVDVRHRDGRWHDVSPGSLDEEA